MNNKKLFVGNLPYSVTEDQLRELFAQAGTVEAVTLISDKYTGRAKGFGFVEMSTEEEAQEAVKKFNQYSMDNRNIAVDVAKPMTERSDRGPRSYGNDNRGGGGRRDY